MNMDKIWSTPEGTAALAYANNNLALAKAFLAGYLYALPYKRKEYQEQLARPDIADDPAPAPGEAASPSAGVPCGAACGSDVPDLHDDEASFNLWWNLYSKKRSRRKAFLKWKSLPLYKRKACIEATPAYVRATPDVQFRKDPTTYLNNESYYDELVPQKQDEPGYDPYAKAASILRK